MELLADFIRTQTGALLSLLAALVGVRLLTGKVQTSGLRTDTLACIRSAGIESVEANVVYAVATKARV